jgi:hypothetical protein
MHSKLHSPTAIIAIIPIRSFENPGLYFLVASNGCEYVDAVQPFEKWGHYSITLTALDASASSKIKST